MLLFLLILKLQFIFIVICGKSTVKIDDLARDCVVPYYLGFKTVKYDPLNDHSLRRDFTKRKFSDDRKDLEQEGFQVAKSKIMLINSVMKPNRGKPKQFSKLEFMRKCDLVPLYSNQDNRNRQFVFRNINGFIKKNRHLMTNIRIIGYCAYRKGGCGADVKLHKIEVSHKYFNINGTAYEPEYGIILQDKDLKTFRDKIKIQGGNVHVKINLEYCYGWSTTKKVFKNQTTKKNVGKNVNKKGSQNLNIKQNFKKVIKKKVKGKRKIIIGRKN